jgi:ATP-dependent Lon protease
VHVAPSVAPPPAREPEPKEQHYTIRYGDTGYSYETIMSSYLRGATAVVVEDPYIRITHQIQNFARFCEMIVVHSAIKKITLITSYEGSTPAQETLDKLNDLKQSLLEMDIVLNLEFNPVLHDREIRLDNGWVIKIGRGLDFYQRPDSYFAIGANDLSLRKCLETKVDIYKIQAAAKN